MSILEFASQHQLSDKGSLVRAFGQDVAFDFS